MGCVKGSIDTGYMTRFALPLTPNAKRDAQTPSLWHLGQALNQATQGEVKARQVADTARRRLDQTRHDARNLSIAARRLLDQGDIHGAGACLRALEAWFSATTVPTHSLRDQLAYLLPSWQNMRGPGVSLDVAVSPAVDDWPPCHQVAMIAADNLVRNALGATKRGAVRLQVSQSSAWLRLTVIDTGPGMGASQHAQGLGIGLDLLRSLLDEFNGTLLVRSRPTGVWAQASYPIDSRAA